MSPAVALLGALAFHLVAAVLGWLVASWLAADQAAIAPAILERIIDNPRQVEIYLADIRFELAKAALIALGISFLLAAGWLVVAHQARPASDRQARAKLPLWALLLAVALIAAAVTVWQIAIDGSVATLMAPGLGLNFLFATLLLVAVAYWLSTAVFAPRVLRVSVPLADGILGR
ncbi:MAG: hypothetical protein SNJ63_05740 [Sphingomonadaceae bacterium]